MPLARINSTILNFIHIPKTGGNSVETLLERLGPLALRGAGPQNWMLSPAEHFHAEMLDKMIRPAFYDHSFTILRDPVARMRSEFRYRATGWLRMRERKGLPKDTGLPDGTYRVRLGSGTIVTDFEGYVPAALEAVAADPFASDNHLRPQVEFPVAGTCLFLHEDGMAPVLDWLASVTGVSREALGDMPVTNQSGDITAPLSETAEAAIRAFYADDLELIETVRAAKTPYVFGGGRDGYPPSV